jgi:FkbM family methyltransferase
MQLLGRMLSVIPVRVGLSGKSARVVTWLGDRLYDTSKLGKISHCGRIIDFTGHPSARVISYAPHNFFMAFMKSDLGHFMSASLLAGDTFVDIGANYGGYSYLGKRMLLNVINIEPHPEIGAFLADNEDIFGKHLGVGVSDDNGSLSFFVSDQNPEGHSFVESSLPWDDSGYSRKISVQVDKFDRIFENEIEENKHFQLVKIDVEGHENAVVDGMSNALSKGLVRDIWCEVRGPGSDRNPSSYKGVCETLDEFGFSAYTYSRGNVEPFDPDRDDVPQYFDLLFMKDERS